MELPVEHMRVYCERQPIRRLSVFGSYLGEHFSDDSDVDLLVEYVQDSCVTLLDMAQHEYDFTEMIGQRVDLRTPADLSRYFRDDVMQMAKSIYEA